MFNKYFLAHGPHATRENGMCAMEWTAYLAGEAHSDSPKCVSGVLRNWFVGLNDAMLDHDRQRLRPYLARTIGTMDDGHDQERIKLLETYSKNYHPEFDSASRRRTGLKIHPELWELLDALLPTEPLQLPVAEDAEAFFAEPIPEFVTS